MTWSILNSNVNATVNGMRALAVSARAATVEIEALEEKTTRTRKTSQELIADARKLKEQETLRSLENGYTASIIASWWQIVIVDANNPGLSSLETEMRRFSGLDLSFMARIRRELSKVQQQNKKKNRGAFGGALSADQYQQAINEYKGGA